MAIDVYTEGQNISKEDWRDKRVKGVVHVGSFISYTPAVEIVSVVIVVEFVATVERYKMQFICFILFINCTNRRSRGTEHNFKVFIIYSLF